MSLFYSEPRHDRHNIAFVMCVQCKSFNSIKLLYIVELFLYCIELFEDVWIHLTYLEMIFTAETYTLHKNSSAIKSPENIQQKTKLRSFAKYLDKFFALICLNNMFFWQGLHNF